MGKKFRILAFIPMLIMMGIIWGFSANSGEESSVQSLGIVYKIIDVVEEIQGKEFTPEERISMEEYIHTPIRKCAHMTEYLVFALTVAFPLCLYMSSKKRVQWTTFCYCTLYATLDEVHQLYVPERSGQVTDVIVDGVGVAIGVLIFSKVYGVIHASEI